MCASQVVYGYNKRQTGRGGTSVTDALNGWRVVGKEA